MPDANLTYDAIAEDYQRLAVPLVFLRPARDLLTALKLSPDANILDVGAGTGVTAQAIQEIENFNYRLVELDISLEMLKASSSSSSVSKVVGQVPGLPFRDNSFEAVISSFVMSHVFKYQEAIVDMVRVLKPEGKIGIAAWGSEKHKYSDMWDKTSESFVSKDLIEKIVSEFMPSREIFTNPENIKGLLEKAGVQNIEILKSETIVTTTIADYIEMKGVMLQGRFIKSRIGKNGWSDFLALLTKHFDAKFSDPIEYPSRAHLVVGSKS
ncbi:MAG: methyltransferase domain-containing protein [candidate division Zixibacteria bacterium]|nr:methyltransferase domain-containing protein [candidate division Zixibacteria bacterium]